MRDECACVENRRSLPVMLARAVLRGGLNRSTRTLPPVDIIMLSLLPTTAVLALVSNHPAAMRPAVFGDPLGLRDFVAAQRGRWVVDRDVEPEYSQHVSAHPIIMAA